MKIRHILNSRLIMFESHTKDLVYWIKGNKPQYIFAEDASLYSDSNSWYWVILGCNRVYKQTTERGTVWCDVISNLRCKHDCRQKDLRVWKHQGTSACLFHVANVLPIILDIIKNKTWSSVVQDKRHLWYPQLRLRWKDTNDLIAWHQFYLNNLATRYLC